MIKIQDADNTQSLNGHKDKVDLFKSKIGLFCVIDYFGDIGINEAKGRLDSVSDIGDIRIVHLSNPNIDWGFNIHQIRNYKFSPVKREANHD